MVNSDAALTNTLLVTWYYVNMKVRTKTTNSSGHFALKLDLPPKDEKPTTYTITASFEGEEGQIKTAYATAPDGTQYPICTTIQHDYLPASTTATLTVEPPTTTVTEDPETTATEQTESSTVEIPPTKTPEEMQEEAEDEGWLKIKHKFSWWYSWYRMHLVLGVDLPQGHLHMDYGWFTHTAWSAALNILPQLRKLIYIWLE